MTPSCNCRLFLCFGMALLIGSGAAAAAPESDDEQIQGVWKFKESWDDGKHADVSSTPIAVRFSGTDMEYGRLIEGKFLSEEKPFRFNFKLSPSKTPKHLDTKLGARVYTLDGDTLVIVGFSHEPKDQSRPKEDRPATAPKKGKEGDGLWIGVFMRVKTDDHSP